MVTLRNELTLKSGHVLRYEVDDVTLSKKELAEYYEIDVKQSNGIALSEVEQGLIDELRERSLGRLTIEISGKIYEIKLGVSELSDFSAFVNMMLQDLSARYQKTQQHILLENNINTELSQAEKDKISHKIYDDFGITHSH